MPLIMLNLLRTTTPISGGWPTKWKNTFNKEISKRNSATLCLNSLIDQHAIHSSSREVI